MTDKRGISRSQHARVVEPDRSLHAVPPLPPDAGGATRLVPTPARRAARRRGASFRRLLSLADTVALMAGLAVAYVAVLGTPVADLLWGFAFAPVWILMIKLHGLYDQDHRRIRHSTLDDIPALISA